MEHIWTIENWEKNINLHEQGHRTSLRIRFDKDIDSEVRKSCKEFVSFLRKEYFFHQNPSPYGSSYFSPSITISSAFINILSA